MVGYNFRTDAERICKRFKFAIDLTGMSEKEFNKAIDDFAAGRIRLLIGHPKSVGHGTDGLQYGGNILVWFGLPWPLDLYEQMNKRLSVDQSYVRNRVRTRTHGFVGRRRLRPPLTR